MKTQPYFPHDFHAAADYKCQALMKKHGLRGYGAFWMIIETLSSTSEKQLPLSSYSVLAHILRCKIEFVRSVIEDFGLFHVTETHFHSTRLLKDALDFESKMAKISAKSGELTPEEEAKKQAEISEKRRKSALIRHHGKSDRCKTDAKPMQNANVQNMQNADLQIADLHDASVNCGSGAETVFSQECVELQTAVIAEWNKIEHAAPFTPLVVPDAIKLEFARRLKEHGKEKILEALESVKTSEFWRKKANRKIGFYDFVKEETFLKLLGGFYAGIIEKPPDQSIRGSNYQDNSDERFENGDLSKMKLKPI